MAPPSGSSPICRYFASGQCKFGSSCSFTHDRNALPSMVCRFNERGTCSYGTACRYDHVRPRVEERTSSVGRSGGAGPSGSTMKKVEVKKAKPPPPTQLHKSTLNADAPEFVPSWLKKDPLPGGCSYAQAAGAMNEEVIRLPSLCPYHELGNCPKGFDCEYAHGELCDLCGLNVLDPLDETQQASHKAECTAKHEQNMQLAFLEQRSQDKHCGICMENIYEKNLRFGILENCKHCFCTICIRTWRGNTENFEVDTVRSCPECRQHSDFIVPSVIWVEEAEEKTLLFAMYKENTKTKPCKYYKSYSSGDCPFGNKCFYSHINPDGTLGEDGPPNRRRQKVLLSDFLIAESDDDLDDFEELMDDADRMRLLRRGLRDPLGDGTIHLETLRQILQRLVIRHQ